MEPSKPVSGGQNGNEQWKYSVCDDADWQQPPLPAKLIFGAHRVESLNLSWPALLTAAKLKVNRRAGSGRGSGSQNRPRIANSPWAVWATVQRITDMSPRDLLDLLVGQDQ